MKFKTMTSEYEISADEFGIMTLKKVAMLPNRNSSIGVGKTYYAKRGDAILLKQDNRIQLLLGKMGTSHIEEYEELERWLKEHY